MLWVWIAVGVLALIVIIALIGAGAARRAHGASEASNSMVSAEASFRSGSPDRGRRSSS